MKDIHTLDNGVTMLKCKPLNWQVRKLYAAPINEEEANRILYVIDVGGIDDMWEVIYVPEEAQLIFSSVHYSNHEVYKFKVDSFEQASDWVLRFAKGMDREKDIEGTIYTHEFNNS